MFLLADVWGLQRLARFTHSVTPIIVDGRSLLTEVGQFSSGRRDGATRFPHARCCVMPLNSSRTLSARKTQLTELLRSGLITQQRGGLRPIYRPSLELMSALF